MTFTNENKNLSLIIKYFKKNGDNYEIGYLDGSIQKYYYSRNESERIKKIMIDQAIDRQQKINITSEKMLKFFF